MKTDNRITVVLDRVNKALSAIDGLAKHLAETAPAKAGYDAITLVEQHAHTFRAIAHRAGCDVDAALIWAGADHIGWAAERDLGWVGEEEGGGDPT